jgi:hypothetical protein
VPASIQARNESLREYLLQVIQRSPEASSGLGLDGRLDVITAPNALPDGRAPIDVVVSLGEINDEHGTGPLVKRVFKGRRGIFSIRSQDHWRIHDFGDWHVRLSPKRPTREECFREVLRVLAGRNIRTITCVPFSTTEIFTSIAIHEIFGAKLCIWIMDDQNVAVNGIPDPIMRECLERCSLRLFTHPELRFAYEQKYGLPGYILPAVVPSHLIVEEPLAPAYDHSARKGALLGSFWDQSWFDRLCSVLEQCGSQIDWYGQNSSPWLKFPPEDMARAGIRPFGIIPEDRLAKELRKYPFVIVPVGALDEKETNKGVASLSLPGRILFAAATSHTPILVVGSEQTCGARFVTHFGIGVVVPYDASDVSAAMDRLSQPDVQFAARHCAAAIAPSFSDRGIVDWLATSVEQGSPADDRFENAFSSYNADRKRPLVASTGAQA